MNPAGYIGSREHERAIVEAVTRKRVEVFGEADVQLDKEDELFPEIKVFIKKETKDWPKAPRSGSRFIDSYCTVSPRLDVMLVAGENDPLFLDQIRKKFAFGPLANVKCGNLTDDDTNLKIQNLHITEPFVDKASQRQFGPSGAAINNSQPIYVGPTRDEPNVLTAQAKAHIVFKGFLDGEQTVEVEKREGVLGLKIKIKLCELRGKIGPDGSVTLTERILSDGTAIPLENGPTFNIHDAINIGKVRRVKFPYEIFVPFRCA